MLAVHFGAGNIGRGFIGGLLSKSGYDVTFVDVNEEIVDLLNKRKEYTVVLADEGNHAEKIRNVSALNSLTEPEQVVEAIAKADLVTTAVGPNILPIIAELMYKGLSKRSHDTSKPLNIIACENMIGGSAFLKEHVYDKASEEEQKQFDQLFAFPNAAVDRIVPNQTNEDKLLVSVEPFYEWVVEETATVGDVPPVNGITYVQDLTPYIERKLFTVNTGHAIVSYIGYQYGYKTVKEAIDDRSVYQSVLGALKESGAVLIEKYGFTKKQHEEYILKIVARYQNRHLSDELTRVGRAPIRKLGPNDRLISPAKQYYDMFETTPMNLTKGIAAALLYDDVHDGESVELQKSIRDQGVSATIQKICELEENHPLAQAILTQVEAFQQKK
ncbi:mannitol-1-phosphate 5-dehydrogenase [Salirhabdus salicampi]|uniref:mannitol-1-phosphate 5-dehydrogenase n=1 Tax=Salirhabdus salicampi TaxID=476102 RepID=UPI0020C3D96D|nr:mannitol-1-phosphate 5-dehydrogenase [Salirhabdus salicampi]MCP8617430.1 mannitol-1-phosphate 5-dehydrogenase [Salirhabdus salicampi]